MAGSAWLGLAFEGVGLETGSTAAWLYSGLRDRGVPAVCIDPHRLRAITKTMRIKNDRNDARAIAHCMRVGWYSVVYVKSEVSQVVRMLLTNRRTLQIKQMDIEKRDPRNPEGIWDQAHRAGHSRPI